MQKRKIFYITLVIAIVIMSGCTDNASSEQEFITFSGKMAMLTEDVTLQDSYMITLNADNEMIYQELSGDPYTLKKNDLVIVIESSETEARILPALSDFPQTRGTVETDQLTYDEALIKEKANQALLNGVMGYDSIDGNEIGIQESMCTIVERSGEWTRVSVPMEASDTWVKTDQLSYDVENEVVDIEK